MNTNPFYICQKYCLLIYETRERAAATSKTAMERAHSGDIVERSGVAYWGPDPERAVRVTADFWSQYLKSKVIFSLPKEPIYVISKDHHYWHVIIGNKFGWIIVRDWLQIKQLENS